MEPVRIKPTDLTGPRSFFTDWDPSDTDYTPADVLRKLKLQLLTKQRVVIAASSLYHEASYETFQQTAGLDTFLSDGTILPAIRDQFSGPTEFFQHKKEYPRKCADYFSSITSDFLSWSLEDNSRWFTGKILDSINDTESLLRQNLGLNEVDAQRFGWALEQTIDDTPDSGFLTRQKINRIAEGLSSEQQEVVRTYVDLVYRISGTRVVNCEGHFPQSNLTHFQLAGNESRVSEEAIFWDIFVEAIVSYLNSAIKISPDRLDQFSFEDIRTIRHQLALKDFIQVYDDLISKAKKRIQIDDPDKMLMQQEEIMAAVEKLHVAFSDRVRAELGEKDSTARSGRLWEVINVLAMISNPAIGFVVSCLSSLKALPEITVLSSPKLADSFNRRKMWLEKFVNSRIGWSGKHRRALVESYKALVQHGLDS